MGYRRRFGGIRRVFWLEFGLGSFGDNRVPGSYAVDHTDVYNFYFQLY